MHTLIPIREKWGVIIQNIYQMYSLFLLTALLIRKGHLDLLGVERVISITQENGL